MIDYKLYLGILAVIIELASYAIYFWGIYKGKTKPHAFTWFVWGTANIVAYLAILFAGGGAGAWVFGVNAICCYLISIIGFKQQHVVYDTYDWLSLFGALLGIFLWFLTRNPLYAVLLISLSDIISIIPTLRKAYNFPFEENASSFAVGIFYYPLSILALGELSLTTWLYPAVIIVLDSTLVILILIRRKKLK